MMMVHLDPEKEIENIVNHIRRYFVENGDPNTKAVIGISGGKDSTIAAALLVRALGPERVIGVMMPNGEQADIEDSIEVCRILGIHSITVNIGPAFEALTEAMPGGVSAMNSVYMTNTPARLRMATLYGIAANVGGRVINTGNASEAYVGYTTKYGDLAGDYAVLRDYYVTEVYKIGDALTELPYHLVHKAPSDGMSGKTDADNMGFSYEILDNYLFYGAVPNIEVLHNITARHERNRHKEVINLPHPKAKNRSWTVIDPKYNPTDFSQ